MSLETQVSGDPAACHRSARQLADLARATDLASTSLARCSTVSAADFGGRSGDAFRGHAAALAGRLSAESDRCHALGRAMEQLAHDLDRVTALMEQARDAARTQRLVVQGDTIVRPGAYADPEQHRAWRELGAVVAGIRELEDRAQRDWTRALEGAGSGRPPARQDRPGPSPVEPAPDGSGAEAPQPVAPTVAPQPTGPAEAPAAAGLPTSSSSPPVGPPAPTTWAAEELGVHAVPWLPPGTVTFEEVLGESR